LLRPKLSRNFLPMIIIRFPDDATKRRALEFLIGRFNGHTWATGEMAVPEEALGPMARDGISFHVQGPATYEQILSLRTPVAPAV
jgi:hypothetical protein